MKVFISWSGERSRKIAKLLRDWLPNVIQSVDPWMSETDIFVGQRWSTELATQLEEASCGLICITSDNKNKPWLQFEAGGLARSLTAKVIPVLWDISAADLDGPLAQFQAATIDENGMRSVVTSIHKCADSKLTSERLTKSFEKFWPDLAQEFEKLRKEEVINRMRGQRGPEVEFEDHQDASTWRSGDPKISALAKLSVQLSRQAVTDCRSLKLKQDLIRSFVIGEVERHPILFRSTFASIPIPFHSYVMLVSWDGDTVTIERLLYRENVYEVYTVWIDCLSAYRKATMLPYRQRDPSILINTTEARRSANTYKRLIDCLERFASISPDTKIISSSLKDLGALFEEANISLDSGDISTSTARLEAVLSISHKLILRYAPQGVGEPVVGATNVSTPKLTSGSDNSPSILLVDDEEYTLEMLAEGLKFLGFYVYGTSNPIDALRVMVDRQFDIVLTDLVMPNIDGVEIIRAAKKHNEDCRCIVISGYPVVENVVKVIQQGASDFLTKPFTFETLVMSIRRAYTRSQDSHDEKRPDSKEGVRQTSRLSKARSHPRSAPENRKKPRRP